MSMTRIDYVEMPLASEIDGIGGFASPKKAGLMGRNVSHGPPVGQHDVPRTDEGGS